jgi:CHAT domain-containing protein/tetratricopeptide (TPR) repeat protein
VDEIEAEVEWAKLNEQVLEIYTQGDIHLALPLAEQALELARLIYLGDHDNLATSVNNLAVLYKDQGKLSAAKPLYEEVLGIWRRLFGNRDHNSLATSINNLAGLYQDQGNFSAAEPLYEEALEMCRRLFSDRDHNSLATSVNNLALFYYAQGNFSAAEPLYVEALEMRRRLFGDRDHNSLVTSINNLAVLYKAQGNFSAAEPLYEEVLGMCRRLFSDQDCDSLATSINNLADLYQAQRNFSAAEPLYVEALEMSRRLFNDIDHDNLATSINNLAVLYQVQGNFSAAEPLYVEALEMRRRLFGDRDHDSLMTNVNNLAGLYQAQGNFSAAEPLYEEALGMCRRLFSDRDHNSLAALINNLGLIHIQQQPDRAFPLFLEAVEVEYNILRQWFSYSTESNRLDFIEKHEYRLKILVSLLCQYFPDDSEKTAQVAIAVARRKAFAAQAEVELNYLRYSDRHPNLAADFQALATAQGKLTHLNHTYYHHQGAMDDAARESHQQVKQTLTEQIDRLERKLSANVPELRQLQQHVTLPAIFAALPEDSCAVEFYRFDVYNFGANEWQSPQYVAFILVPGGNVGMVKLGDAGEIDELIRRYRDLACDANLPSFGARPNPSNQQPKPALEVEEISILKSIDLEIKQLIFIPDGALHTLPIGNLLVGQETRLFGKAGFLGERFVCTYLSTLRELLTRTDRPNRSINPSIAIGNPNYYYPNSAPTLLASKDDVSKKKEFPPIPESELLLDSLKLQLESDAQFFTGDRATETILLEAKSPKLLVIITHGELLNRDGDPMQNHGLALTGANSWLAGEKLPAEIGKGFLLARDVAYLDLLGTEIVFLIACSSGLGDVKTGEGVFGLRRAFAIAGVKQLITSLWDVPIRPTMLLTDKFFEEYHRGVAPSISLQTAQHYVRDISRTDLESMPLGKKILDELERHSIRIADPNYPLRHPYFWGAWICQGV